ncbi:MAG: hypothetical protein WKG01_30820 [Kofleriaceae bacterium]
MTVLGHVIDSICPASEAQAAGARQNVAAAEAPILTRLAGLLAARSTRWP